MRTISLVVLSMIMNVALAVTTIKTKIPGNTIRYADFFYMDLKETKLFPQKQYEVSGIIIKNNKFLSGYYNKKVTLKNSPELAFGLKLDLISYNERTGIYHFKITIEQEIILSTYNPGGGGENRHVQARIIFDETKTNSNTFTGKMIPIRTDNLPTFPVAKLNITDWPSIQKDSGIKLGRDEDYATYLLIYDDIPITIELHD